MPAKSSNPLKVFIGCPGDMAPERTLLLSLEKKLAKRGCPVEFLIWPDVPPSAGRPQQVIFDHFPVETWDIFVGLLWNRFGSQPGWRRETDLRCLCHRQSLPGGDGVAIARPDESPSCVISSRMVHKEWRWPRPIGNRWPECSEPFTLGKPGSMRESVHQRVEHELERAMRLVAMPTMSSQCAIFLSAPIWKPKNFSGVVRDTRLGSEASGGPRMRCAASGVDAARERGRARAGRKQMSRMQRGLEG